MDMKVDDGGLLDRFLRRGVGSAGEGDKCSCINPGPTTASSQFRGLIYSNRTLIGVRGKGHTAAKKQYIKYINQLIYDSLVKNFPLELYFECKFVDMMLCVYCRRFVRRLFVEETCCRGDVLYVRPDIFVLLVLYLPMHNAGFEQVDRVKLKKLPIP
jgi:hypothetical protein